ncbi:MAG: AAA family ATPase [Nitrospiraceae bacterium]|jgi:proteasome-associated ATPase|nr:AAA family ATPase [Nitrospiraceae bacterium]
MSDHGSLSPPKHQPPFDQSSPRESSENDEKKRMETLFRSMIDGVDRIAKKLDDHDGIRKDLFSFKKNLYEAEVEWGRLLSEQEKMNEVLEKVTSPAFRIGTLIEVMEDGFVWVSVGGGDYHAALDPRIDPSTCHPGMRVRLNEAMSLVGVLDADMHGPVTRVEKILPDGRLEIGQDRAMGNGMGSMVLGRGEKLLNEPVAPGDSVRLDPSSRLALEKVSSQDSPYLIKEVADISWSDIGGQKEALSEIQKAILNPVLHPDLFQKYHFKSPKGFLLYGPPGCGKTLIGKATANYIAGEMSKKEGREIKGTFFHVKGPEIFNMWLGESERIVRELFAQGRESRSRGEFPVLFIDEAEAILGTRKSSRAFNIHNTIVPMFCAEMDGLSSQAGFMVILATNRPEIIDPAILRPGRIDRKIRVLRPNREAAFEILSLAIPPSIPTVKQSTVLDGKQREEMLSAFLDRLYASSQENAVMDLFFRSGRRETLYRKSFLSGAILVSIFDRAKEKALLRELSNSEEVAGIQEEDLWDSLSKEFEEGDILPDSDVARDWLNLLDLPSRDVVDIRRIRPGEKERSFLERRQIE